MPRDLLDLNRLNIFKEVALAGSFSKAAAKLHQPKSRISRNMAALEQELGVQLVYRTTRQFQLTPAGQQLIDHALPLLRDLVGAVEQVSTSAAEVAGPLRISVPDDVGVELMGGICSSYMARHPRVTIDLHVGNQMVDLVRDSFDLALRIGRLKDSSLIQRRIGQITLAPYLSPTLAERFGGRLKPADLERIPYLQFASSSGPIRTLRLTKGKETKAISVTPVFSANNFFVLRSMAIAGQGLAVMPPFLAREAVVSGRLVPALREWVLEGSPMQVVMPHQRELPLRTKLFVEHLTESLAGAI